MRFSPQKADDTICTFQLKKTAIVASSLWISLPQEAETQCKAEHKKADGATLIRPAIP